MKENFHFEETILSGIKLIRPFYVEDIRGSFLKAFERDAFQSNGIKTQGFELFYTHSKKGTVRGLHFQRKNCQDKLVQVLLGSVYDVVVDLRDGSPTFGCWEGFWLSAQNRNMLYIPEGFAHGFLALEDTLFGYQCGKRYDLDTDGGILWNDPQVAVRWPLELVDEVILSKKDMHLPTLEEFVAQYGSLPSEG